jgi:lysyl-tRNA synthetase class 1
MERNSKEERHNRHWVQKLADEVIAERKRPFIITGGMTTSGPAHLGTVCEFLYPAVLKQAIENKREKVEMHFFGDILDAFDSIPLEMQKYENTLKPELGKPLVYTIDPLGCHRSFGEHYLDQAKYLMKRLYLDINVIQANELYDSGKMDSYARIFLKNEEKVKEVVARTSMRKIEDLKDWSPLMPICEKCGKIATTRVIRHSGNEYEYVCDRDVEYAKGCTYKGKAKLEDHKYKLQWRLHWPAWQALFNSSAEGSGIDHMTVGGSATTAIAIHKEILGREPPILFKYGFILINGKKYSKSKGIGIGAMELSELIPPEILKYALIEPNIEQNKDMDPTGDKLILLYNEVERISTISKPDTRADEKRALAFAIAIKKLPWKSSFVDMLLEYQIYKDWDKVGKKLEDKAGVKYLSGYIEKWLAKGYAPDRYNFSLHQTKVKENIEAIKSLISKLDTAMDELQVHNLVYQVAKEHGIKADGLFKTVYTGLIGKDNGPRLGKLIVAIGVDKVKEMLTYSVN